MSTLKKPIRMRTRRTRRKRSKFVTPNLVRFAGQLLRHIPSPDNPLSKAEHLRREYAEMESAHAAKVMRFLQDAYFIARQFRRRPGDFERLQAHKFWKQWRQKPKDRKTSKWVLYFILQATTTNDRNRARKYAAILDGLMQDEVEISEVAERIKALGGVEAAYKAICARKRGAAVNATDESGDDQSVRSENTRSPTATVVSAHKKKRPFSRKGLRRIFTLSGPLWVRR